MSAWSVNLALRGALINRISEGAMKSQLRHGATTRIVYTAPPVPVMKIPDGWKLVPIEPTRQMMSQGHFAMGGPDRGKFRRIYMAMVAAAPSPELEPNESDDATPEKPDEDKEIQPPLRSSWLVDGEL